MDHDRFDRMTRRLGVTHSRRTTLGALVGTVLAGIGGSTAARGNHTSRKHHGKQRPQKPHRVNAQAAPCWRAGACIPKKGSNVSQCDLAGYTAPPNLNCTGWNLSRANLRGADFSGANFTKTNLSGACLVDADFTGATFANSTNLPNAIFCRTTMPNGSINTSGCGLGTPCCATCDAAHPCPAGQLCAGGRCQTCDGSGDCPDGQICVANPAPICEACSATNSLPDLCAPHEGVICGRSNTIIPECWCVQTVAGGALCTNFGSSLCNCGADEPGCNFPPNTPICASDADCVAIGFTHCIPAAQGDCTCNSGVACAQECTFV